MEKEYFINTILPLKQKLFRKALYITESETEAEDVVQDVMMRLWDKRTEWPHIENIEVYSMVLTRNMAVDKIRQANSQGNRVDMTLANYLASESLHPLERLEKTDEKTLVWSAIRMLPERQQELIRLREVEELSYQEIAQQMNLTESQVKTNLFRARQKIKEIYLKIEQYGL
ncbi:RNA polymerase sigma-70 factor (ECF subfamily) [Parabacteroides sp. PFB2-10]|uniref:RNA polymerase sigma factor n=1 Tax=Parabacteroides sp. PFB2-10 TaxID=1742405 RepID=UPI002476C03C|nr:RNA polymerase sigma factor [Parabacteroides sp. PFB2-10]MDH6312254.1 RNA polymerase sigma-70 factor (ECF subfamily) [Parabacteroides sp. PFB2-10]MDL2244984.1 RNA polymerase sigma factor [Parabacteroides sp. OttesenSCG-928-J18]